MKRTLIIFKAVTKNWMRSRSGLFFSILFPILLLLVFGAVFSGGGTSTYGLFVQNLDITADEKPTNLSNTFLEALNSTETFSIRDIPANVTDVSSYARDAVGPLGGNIRILIISKGFQENLLNGRNASLTFVLDSSDQSSSIVKSIVMNIANAFNYQLIGAKNVINLTEEPITIRQFRNIDFYLPGIIAAFIMTNGIIGVTSNTTEFKRRGIIKRLSITPLAKLEWILGNVLSQTLLNLMLTAIIIVVGWLIFSVQVIPDVFSIVLIFLGSVMFSDIGMVLSGLIKDVEAASAVGNAIAFPMMFLSGTYWPLEIMPTYLQSVARVLPLTYFSEGLRYAMIFKYNEGIFTNMAIVTVLAAVFIILGALVTKWKEK